MSEHINLQFTLAFNAEESSLSLIHARYENLRSDALPEFESRTDEIVAVIREAVSELWR